MHTYLYRINTLFTIASTTLGVICLATALTDWTIRPDPKVHLAVQSFDGLQVSPLQSRSTLRMGYACDFALT